MESKIKCPECKGGGRVGEYEPRNCPQCKGLGEIVDHRLASGFTPDAEFHLNERSKEFGDVLAFHQKFGLLWFTSPGHVTREKLRERIEFMKEELDEFCTGAGFEIGCLHQPNEVLDHGKAPDIAQMADALVDLVYVALGTAVQLGLPWDWLWDDVQRANMEKVRGVTKRGHAVDVTKPPGWQGPQTQRILDIAGYRKSDWFIGDAFREAHARRDGVTVCSSSELEPIIRDGGEVGHDNIGENGSLT